jgi:hypothetical protein
MSVLALGVLGTSLAPGASAAVVDCPPMSSGVCRDLRPVAECAWDNGNGTTSVVWGWYNPHDDTARIQVGSHNQVSPGAQNQGQPTLFAPGRHRNVFVTTTAADETSWRLGNRTLEVELDDDEIDRCDSKPVPQVGDLGALLLGALVLALGALVVVAARPRRLAVAS